jgi:SAM-dependent methyltransferase
MQPKDYKDNFFEYHLEGALNSAKAVIPLVLKYVQPDSIIDVGCGIGAWLSVWEQKGVKELFGIDGNYIDTSKLLIDKASFKAVDLEKGYKSDKQFDLVTCLEVAEHLKAEFASLFIESLCTLGDVVLFSAAIPGQEGTMHVNEQYPEYWANLFKSHGFIPVDCLRHQIWNNKEIQWWYRQNIMFFVRETSLINYPGFSGVALKHENSVLSLVHPEAFAGKTKKADYLEEVLKSPISALRYFFRKK